MSKKQTQFAIFETENYRIYSGTLGVEIFSKKLNGSKWLVDAAAEQFLKNYQINVTMSRRGLSVDGAVDSQCNHYFKDC